ncbi:MAG: hypothetical protein R3F30_13345 [Planctomycetota bacterium]
MLEEALALSPALAEGWLVLAEIHEDNGRYKSAGLLLRGLPACGPSTS